VQFDYSGAAPVLVAFAATFEQHDGNLAKPALRGTVSYNWDTGVAESVTESAGEGSDTVVSSVSYVLPDNVEDLSLSGSGALAGTGNTQDNRLVGNEGANVLAGGAGDDTLTGGAGTTPSRLQPRATARTPSPTSATGTSCAWPA